MNPLKALIPLAALVLLYVPTRGEDYECGCETGCKARINEDGELREEVFRKGDLVSTEAGWVVSPDDGWEKIRSAKGNAQGGTQFPNIPTVYGLGGTPPEVRSGSTWVGGGKTVKITVADPHWGSPTNVTVKFTDKTGNSPPVNGSGGPTSTPDSPTADASDPAQTPGGSGFRVDPATGKYVERKGSDGRWYRMRLFVGKGGPTDEVTGLPH